MAIKINLQVSLIVLFVMLLIIPGHSASAKTVGVIMTADIQYYRDIHKAFIDSLGKDAEVVLQKPMPDPMSWTNAGRKLAGIGVNVIVTYGAPATLTLMKETSDIPIIFAGVYDPESMSMTGKNATGISSTVPVEKIITYLSAVSKLSKLGIIFSKSEKDTIMQVRDIKKNEGEIGFESVLFSLTDKVNKDDIKGVSALILTTCSAGMSNVKDIVEAAHKEKIPTAALMEGGENAGVIFTLAADPEEQGKEISEMVKKILGGAKPSEISLKQPQKVVINVNNKEAKTLGLTIPANILHSATKVIE
jgi:putative ABC transport system substrate-binding protein